MKQIFTRKFILFVSFLNILAITSHAQIAAWDFTGQNAGPATVAATTFNANLVSSSGANNITRGAGAAGSTANNSFRTTGFQNNGIAVGNTDYFQITLAGQPGFSLSLSSINAFMAGTGTYANAPGVSTQFAYSLDGNTFTLIGSPAVTIGTPATLPTINLSGVTALQNIVPGTTATLRFYATGQTATGGWGFISSAAGVNGLAIGGTLTALNPTPTTTSISPVSATAGDPGFSLTVNGTNFINGSSVVTWNGANRTTTFISTTELTAAIPNTDITIPGSAVIGVTTTGAAASSNTQTFTINPSSGPSLLVTSPLTGFGNVCINTTTNANSFTLDGNNLTGSNISLAALPGFTYSETSGGTYTSTLSFSYVGSSFTGKIIYVKFSPLAIQSYNGDISLSGGGISGFLVPATGAGVNSLPSVTTGSSSSVTATTAISGGTITTDGCNPVTFYGIEYSVNSGFADGTGTQVASTNLSAGNFTSSITGLTPNTRYFYKAYATSSTGTAYGTQQAFTNTPLPVLMSAQTDLSFTENFADIANWSNFFISGTGANHFGGLSANATGTIPDGIRITAATNSFQGAAFGSSGGVQKGTDQIPTPTQPTQPSQSIVLLSTGPGDNSSSAAIDFYMDFTGVNAGTVSFDWESVNNSTGDRNGSMRVYTSTDGITFTELTFASVLNFTNNFPTNGTKANIALPASFNNSATARLRFYYYNGTGGITPTGSRPKISIDNLTVTAVASTPCVAPSAPATALVFGTITDVSIQGSFTAASPATDGYLVVMSTSSTLTGNPVDGQIYNIGDNVGDGSVVARGSSTNFTATGLTALTTYYFFVFPVNSICTGGPLYYTPSTLTGSATTIAGLPPCAAPASQPTALVLNPPAPSINSIQGSFTAAVADEYLVLRNTTGTLSNTPVDGQLYNGGDILGNAVVVQSSSATSFAANGLLPNTQYFFFVFSLNSEACVNGPTYNTATPLTGNETTMPLPPCATPSSQPSNLTFNVSNNAISGAFTPVTGSDDYLVIVSTSSSLSATPQNNTDYNEGDNLGGGIVVSNSSANSFLATSLSSGTSYYFYIFSANKNCSGGTKYLIASPLSGNTATSNAPANNFYFGTLHSHSDYSDGNQDNPGFTPTDDYNYALTSQCMDYLGISEHNHFSSFDNPGNTIANYHMGPGQATAFTNAHPGFLALYGMEWGVISGGGHVVVYGDGMDNLWGWESGSGVWGPSNNYDVFVPKNTYTGNTGLFKTINDNIATNTFGTLAHPNTDDYNKIASTTPYDAVADEAITGTAVESGPSSSTNTTYSNPGSSMFYLAYYQTLLAKGYHLGPVVDHDNHKTTFGHTTYSRTAIVAPSLTKTAIISAMRNMNFYATQDCDTKVDFSINTKKTGSIFTDRYAPIIFVTLTDASTNLSGAIIRVMHGTPGSGSMPVKIDSVIGSSLKFIDNNLSNSSTGYYYIDISIGAARIVTSPVWYTRSDNNLVVLPVTLTSFSAQKQNATTLLKWTTSQEINSKEFIIERSSNGSTWQTIATLPAAGSSATTLNYSAIDLNPAKGTNLYRLKSIDKDNKFEYSATRRVNFENKYTYSIYPNPASDIIQIAVDNTSGINASIQILNSQSQVLISKKINILNQLIPVNISSLASGLYFIRIVSPDGTINVQKFTKQ